MLRICELGQQADLTTWLKVCGHLVGKRLYRLSLDISGQIKFDFGQEFHFHVLGSIATPCGYFVKKTDTLEDNFDKIDFDIREPGDVFKVRIQSKVIHGLKSLRNYEIESGRVISYPVDRECVRQLTLRENQAIRLLVLHVTTSQPEDWSSQQGEMFLESRHFSIWRCLNGLDVEANSSGKINIRIPRSKLFTAAVLRNIMEAARKGHSFVE